MARVTVVNLPSWGHILPTLPLMRELVRRGHGVTYFAARPFHAAIAAAGAIAEPLDVEPLSRFPARAEQRIAWALARFRPAIEAVLPRIDRLDPAVLMHGIACAWGKCLSTITAGLPSAALGESPRISSDDGVSAYWMKEAAEAERGP